MPTTEFQRILPQDAQALNASDFDPSKVNGLHIQGNWRPEPIDAPQRCYHAGSLHSETRPDRVVIMNDVAKAARAQALLIARDSAWQHGVTVNTVAPGPVQEIESLEGAISYCAHAPAWRGRATTSPQDVAECVAFLCSESGNFISGAVLPFMYR